LSNDEYAEVSEKEIATVPEESFAVGDVAKGDFILAKLAGKRSTSYYIAEVMNDCNGYGWEIRYYKQLENTNKFFLDKNEYFSILFGDVLWKLLPPLPGGMSKYQASQLYFSVDFNAFNASLAIQHV
jgi:hypothetical protein